MKLLAVVFMVAIVNALSYEIPPELLAEFKKYSLVCMLQEGVSLAEIEELINGDLENVSDKQKCFIKCMLQKIGLLKGVVPQDAVFLQKISPIVGEEKAKEIQALCNGLKGENDCDTAFKIAQCYFNNIDNPSS